MEGDVPALFIDDKVAMTKVRFAYALLLSVVITKIYAQGASDNFLMDMYSINSFKINSALADIQKDKTMSGNLSPFNKIDNESTYFLVNQPINLPGLKALDRLAFDTLELTFENNKLHHIKLNVPERFDNGTFAKTCRLFDAKYGSATVTNVKNNTYKKFTWNLGNNEIIATNYSKGFLIYYGSKISAKKTGWLYTDRKGKGNRTMQFNLSYFEKQLNSNMTIASFEKQLPAWETTGEFNFIMFEFNFKTRALDIPTFMITYSLKSYDLGITTNDTSSKIIDCVRFESVKDIKVWAEFDKDLKDLNYTKSSLIKISRYPMYTNREKHITVLLDRADSIITISKTINPLP